MGQALSHNAQQRGTRGISGALIRARSGEVAAGGRRSISCAFSFASPREVLMGARLISIVFVIVCLVSPLWATDNDHELVTFASAPVGSAAVPAETASDSPIEPWIHPHMPDRLRQKIETGFDIAMRRVQEIEACSDLFTQIGADGIEVLKTGLYFPVKDRRQKIQLCGRAPSIRFESGANLAFTFIGGASTFICPSFSRVSDEFAAIAVIHEALHHAGLPESPVDPAAMTATEITRMVEKACDF
jgi:hypothetical protein